MAAHLIKRKDCGGTWYLVDGDLTRSLKTKARRYAEALLRQYQDEKFGFKRVLTVGEYYDKWIERKIEPLYRRSTIRDYRQNFKAHVLPRFKDVSLVDIKTGDISDFQVELLKKGLKVKSVRNIIDSSFRAIYRDARAEIDELAGKDPFIDVKWPKVRRDPPDPLTAEERDRVLEYFAAKGSFYYPFMRFQFETGCRPSESTALSWADLNTDARTVRINKSRNLNVDNDTKTSKSRRTIIITRELMDLVQTLRHTWSKDADKVFLNKFGEPVTADQFRADYWYRVLDVLNIRRHKFYATRHTFITIWVKAGVNLKAIADYAGTSVQMIEENYCGELRLDPMIFRRANDPTKIQRSSSKSSNNLASPTGFEPVLSA